MSGKSTTSAVPQVAALTAENATRQMKSWTEQDLVGALTVEQARDWQSREPVLWAVVVAPWVFVQERDAPRQ